MRPEPPPIRAARLAAGYGTAASAARAAGLRPNHLSLLERGGKAPTWATMSRLIGGLGLGLEFFHDEQAILDAADRIRAAAPTEKKGAGRP